MSQNRSSAVMQQRREAHDSLDDFPTPPWATRALCEHLALHSARRLGELTCREPAANRGYMFRPLNEYFAYVEGFDVHDYGAGFPVADFLFPTPLDQVDWTISNPPFRLAEQFIERALASSREGVAMLVRSAFLEGEERCEQLFSLLPPSQILQFSERVVMHKGVLRQAGSKYECPDTGEMKRASSATAYCWLVWRFVCGKLPAVTTFHWLPPCRRRLERDGDYA